MSESDEIKAYMSVDFGEQGGQFSWISQTDASNWITKQRNEWSWISGQGLGPSNSAWQIISSALDQATGNINQAQQYLNQGQPQNEATHIASARTYLEGLFKNHPWLLTDSARHNFIKNLKDTGHPLDAAMIVANWMGVDLSGPPIKITISALIQSELFERGIKDRAKGEGNALKKLAGDLQTTLAGYQQAERNQSNRFDTLHGAISTQSEQQQSTFDTVQIEREGSWEKLLSDSQTELTRLKETYDQHMALAAPVEYWETKRKGHRKWSIGSFSLVAIGMVAAGYFLHTELQSIEQVITATNIASTVLPQGKAAISVVQPLIQSQSGSIWHFGSFILLATLSFWFIRLLVRIFLSHLHLENDAAERVTMAKTYLALIRNDDLPKGDSINTILAALFRPTGDGIVKDEGIPPTTLEWFTKLGK